MQIRRWKYANYLRFFGKLSKFRKTTWFRKVVGGHFFAVKISITSRDAFAKIFAKHRNEVGHGLDSIVPVDGGDGLVVDRNLQVGETGPQSTVF